MSSLLLDAGRVKAYTVVSNGDNERVIFDGDANPYLLGMRANVRVLVNASPTVRKAVSRTVTSRMGSIEVERDGNARRLAELFRLRANESPPVEYGSVVRKS